MREPGSQVRPDRGNIRRPRPQATTASSRKTEAKRKPFRSRAFSYDPDRIDGLVVGVPRGASGSPGRRVIQNGYFRRPGAQPFIFFSWTPEPAEGPTLRSALHSQVTSLRYCEFPALAEDRSMIPAPRRWPQPAWAKAIEVETRQIVNHISLDRTTRPTIGKHCSGLGSLLWAIKTDSDIGQTEYHM